MSKEKAAPLAETLADDADYKEVLSTVETLYERLEATTADLRRAEKDLRRAKELVVAQAGCLVKNPQGPIPESAAEAVRRLRHEKAALTAGIEAARAKLRETAREISSRVCEERFGRHKELVADIAQAAVVLHDALTAESNFREEIEAAGLSVMTPITEFFQFDRYDVGDAVERLQVEMGEYNYS